MDAGFALFDHTADAGFTAWGGTAATAFAQAARGMFAIMLGEDPQTWKGTGSAETLTVEATGEDWAELLVNWLADLLYQFEVDRFLPLQVGFDRCEPPACVSHLEGIVLDAAEALGGGVGIKAITYHQLLVDVRPERTDLRVIVDI